MLLQLEHTTDQVSGMEHCPKHPCQAKFLLLRAIPSLFIHAARSQGPDFHDLKTKTQSSCIAVQPWPCHHMVQAGPGQHQGFSAQPTAADLPASSAATRSCHVGAICRLPHSQCPAPLPDLSACRQRGPLCTPHLSHQVRSSAVHSLQQSVAASAAWKSHSGASQRLAAHASSSSPAQMSPCPMPTSDTDSRSAAVRQSMQARPASSAAIIPHVSPSRPSTASAAFPSAAVLTTSEHGAVRRMQVRAATSAAQQPAEQQGNANPTLAQRKGRQGLQMVVQQPKHVLSPNILIDPYR